ncbi:MAG TPA: hypothetical protein VHK88_17310 [Aquihabitans sp.]|jgi:hypothetical protein|nr:hypothetical protein [Aquihabitans sp.]
MELAVYRAYDNFDNRRHAIGLRSRTACGLTRNHVRSTTLAFDPDDFFDCKQCLANLPETAG